MLPNVLASFRNTHSVFVALRFWVPVEAPQMQQLLLAHAARLDHTLFCEEVLFVLAFHLALIRAEFVVFFPEFASLPSSDVSLCGIVLQPLLV
jgi:hypothetical protein